MSRDPEAHTRSKTSQLTHFMPRRRERGSADAGFLRRAGGTAPLLPTKPRRQAEESFTSANSLDPSRGNPVWAVQDVERKQSEEWTPNTVD